jgi:hypothetical protein
VCCQDVKLSVWVDDAVQSTAVARIKGGDRFLAVNVVPDISMPCLVFCLNQAQAFELLI